MNDSPATISSALPLSLGRHRAAIRLVIGISAIALAGPLLRMFATLFANSVLVGWMFDAFAMLAAAPATSVMLTGLLVVLLMSRVHPAMLPRYAAWLATTPWRHGMPLPMGSLSLASAFVLAPAAVLAGLWQLGLQAAPWIALGAVIGYTLFGLLSGLIARQPSLTWLILLTILIVPPAAVAETWIVAAIAILACLVLASLAQSRSLNHAIISGAPDWRRLGQKRSTLGWFQNLPLQRPARNLKAEFLGCLFFGTALTSVTFTAGGFKGVPFRELLSIAIILFALAQFGLGFASAPLSFGLIARVTTGRWFIPRMDRMLVCPAVLAGWVIVLRLFPWEPLSPWNTVFGGAFLTIALLLAGWTAPSRIAWQTTGASRISLAPNQTQKQAEINLRRVVGT